MASTSISTRLPIKIPLINGRFARLGSRKKEKISSIIIDHQGASSQRSQVSVTSAAPHAPPSLGHLVISINQSINKLLRRQKGLLLQADRMEAGRLQLKSSAPENLSRQHPDIGDPPYSSASGSHSLPAAYRCQLFSHGHFYDVREISRVFFFQTNPIRFDPI